jgi:hypothetical protein
VAEGRISAISLGPLQGRLTVSRFKPLIEALQARPACVAEAWQPYRKSVDTRRDRHPSVYISDVGSLSGSEPNPTWTCSRLTGTYPLGRVASTNSITRTSSPIGQAILLQKVVRSPRLYADVYWLSVITEFFLQLGVVLEIARIVLRPTGTWLHDARFRFVLSGIAGALIAAGLAVILHPSAPTSLDAWVIRGNLFTGIIVLELCSAMMGAANRLGLQWDTHVMGLGQELASPRELSSGINWTT